jgi:hypothetical protein
MEVYKDINWIERNKLVYGVKQFLQKYVDFNGKYAYSNFYIDDNNSRGFIPEGIIITSGNVDNSSEGESIDIVILQRY